MEAGGAFATSNPSINRVQTKVDSNTTRGKIRSGMRQRLLSQRNNFTIGRRRAIYHERSKTVRGAWIKSIANKIGI